MEGPILAVSNLKKYFPVTSGVLVKRTHGYVHAVDDVTFQLYPGKTLAVVGESGSGKTTLAKLIVRLLNPTSGSITLDGVRISDLRGKALLAMRKRMGIIFQDPFASLDPRMTVGRIVGEPLRVHGFPESERPERISRLLEIVGLNPDDGSKFPHQFSGGQRQRISTARALALSPELIIADEPVSALDVSIQAKIINLFMKLQSDLGLSFMVISHDLGVVSQISHDVAVMYLGKIIEFSETEDLFLRPLHPYTQALLAAIPVPDAEVMRSKPPVSLKGEIPSLVSPPVGCRFNTRCPYAKEICHQREPPLEDAGAGHLVACHFWDEIQQRGHS